MTPMTHAARAPIQVIAIQVIAIQVIAIQVIATIASVACLLASSATALGAQAGDVFRISDAVSDSHVEYGNVEIPSGGERVLADIRGPAKITYFYFTDESKGHVDPSLVLKIFWDDEREPSVLVPLAACFGVFEDRAVDYQSAFLQVNHHAYMSYLPMPFARRARIVLANDGERPYRRLIAHGIDFERSERYREEPSRLHAWWHRSNPVRSGIHTIAEMTGRGHYVGNFLQVNTAYAGWWGEGNTMFTIDSKKVTHSPGTEDEYGSTWGFDRTFSYLNVGYLEMNGGHHRMYRWYAANPVRFQMGLRVEIENQHFVPPPESARQEAFRVGQQSAADDYTSVAFRYQIEPHARLSLAPHRERVAPAQRSAERPAP